ncbi:MAG: nuclear transport factor 2 family protein [Bryobacter sp.]|jgi:ketosteroid isomerase-like protein|nr:nuclear transport factor 2 family protein [Bryobacter sp.]
MKPILTLLGVAALALLVSLVGCQQPKPEAPAALLPDDVAAIGKAIDGTLAAFVAKDIDKTMTFYAEDAVMVEYAQRNQGAKSIREDHILKEFADRDDSVPMRYEAADRIVRGKGGFAYVTERNIVEAKSKDGKLWKTDTAMASYVMEKQSDGAWKCVQMHWSGPMSWTPVPPEKGKAKK